MAQVCEAEEVRSAAVQATELDRIRPQDGDMVDVSIYASGRDVVGTTVFAGRRRWAQVWTLECGERLLLLGKGERLLHWEPSLEPLKAAEGRLLDWLAEPMLD